MLRNWMFGYYFSSVFYLKLLFFHLFFWFLPPPLLFVSLLSMFLFSSPISVIIFQSRHFFLWFLNFSLCVVFDFVFCLPSILPRNCIFMLFGLLLDLLFDEQEQESVGFTILLTISIFVVVGISFLTRKLVFIVFYRGGGLHHTTFGTPYIYNEIGKLPKITSSRGIYCTKKTVL